MSANQQTDTPVKQTRRAATLGCALFLLAFGVKAAADYQVHPLPIVFVAANLASSFGLAVGLARITRNYPVSGPKSVLPSALAFLVILVGPLWIIPWFWQQLLFLSPAALAPETAGITRELAQSQGVFASVAGCFLGVTVGSRVFPRVGAATNH
jgi:hypothetical protein